jgi:hypothetical protein
MHKHPEIEQTYVVEGSFLHKLAGCPPGSSAHPDRAKKCRK